jgi:7-cyano-7-deazaguanine synthase in queuosine biosynthesis
MLDFLTGDLWSLTFRPRTAEFEAIVTPRPLSGTSPFGCVSLFSGGADSLVGAIDLLTDGETPLFVSHAGDGPTSDAQNQCYRALRSHYGVRPFNRLRVWTVFPDDLVAGVAKESTTRGRSFLFIALGMLAATGLEEPIRLHVPENGLIALNVPLDQLRLGSLSTKTTHPFYIACWNELIAHLGIAGRIVNPYSFKTKGEMVSACLAPELARQVLPDSLSCASPAKARWQGHGIEHCGYCVPCLIRRAALDAAWGSGNDPTRYTLSDLEARPLDSLQAEGKQVRSFQLAVARLQSRPTLAQLLIHKPGPLPNNSVDLRALADVYARGLREVGMLLENVQTTPG